MHIVPCEALCAILSAFRGENGWKYHRRGDRGLDGPLGVIFHGLTAHFAHRDAFNLLGAVVVLTGAIHHGRIPFSEWRARIARA